MKNRTSLTLVISLLVCSLTAGAFAQTNPSVLKPGDSTLEARESDVQFEQAGNANGQCPYKVVPGDKVYLQIKNVKLRSDNLPLKPYFYVYGRNGDNWKKISGTSSQDGNQICNPIKYPSKFQFYIDNTYQDYCIDVHSKWYKGDQLVAKGISINAANLLKWADDPQNKDKTYKLEISKGNTIEFKFDYVKKDRYYYFEIVSYKITNLDNEYKKYLYEAYQTWLLTKQNGVEDKWLYYYKGDKKFNPATENAQDYAEIAQNKYKKEQRELLFPCTEGNNVKFLFSFNGKEYSLDTMELTTEDIVNQLNDCIQKYPDDPTKWVVKCVSKQNSEIVLSFAGIQRIYRITTVTIPNTHSKRQNPRYSEKGYAPWMRVYIQQNGEVCGINSKYARTGRRAWDCDIPNDKYNRFKIREGINARFSLQIKDADTWAYEIALVEISGIKDLDFAKGVIYEKLDSMMDDDDKRTKIQFEEVKE